MSRTLLALCLLGLMVATTMARPHKGRGGKRGRKGGPGSVLYELTCERVDLERGGTYKRGCDEGACSLGNLVYEDEEGTPIMTVKFCDALDMNGTSLVAAAACLITDPEGSVLVERTKPERPPREDESHEDREPPACEIELDIVYFEEPAKAYFPNKPCGRKGMGREEDEDEDDEDVEGDEGSPAEQGTEGGAQQAAEGGEQQTGRQTGRQRRPGGGRRTGGRQSRGREEDEDVEGDEGSPAEQGTGGGAQQAAEGGERQTEQQTGSQRRPGGGRRSGGRQSRGRGN